MKLTWKNKNKNKNNKRTVSAVSHYPALPFEQDDQTEQNHHNNDNDDDDERGRAVVAEYNEEAGPHKTLASDQPSNPPYIQQLADEFLAKGNKLAEDGKYREALGKWEAAITLMPERAILHEQKAQALLEIGDAWNALKAATRATELEPSWAEAWMTLGRAQLNFGEPDAAVESFDKSLAIKPDSKDARDDRQTAMHLVKKRKLLHSSGLSSAENRYAVGDKTETS